MNKKTNLLLGSLLISVGLFVYLTLHHYAVKIGLSGSSLCSISATLNCDAAATSSFSELFGIPLAVLGGVFSLLLFGFVLFLKLDWIEKTIFALSTVRFMLLVAAGTSLIMGFISLYYIKVLCPFCIGTYIFSFLQLFLGWNLFQAPEKTKEFPHFLSGYMADYKSHLIFLACVPVFAWAFAGMIKQQYGLDEVQKLIPEKLIQWKASPVQVFNLSEGLIRPGTDTKVTLVEFADFKCSHCKAASSTIDSFLKGNPQVTFIYKPFPLDGSCNKSIPNKGDGSRCTLAAWALCAEKNEKRGWDVHHWIFENQEQLFAATDLKPYLVELEKTLKIDTAKLTACSDSSETYDLILRTSEEGAKAQVQGTPTIYMNGKKLPYGQFLDVLKAASAEVN